MREAQRTLRFDRLASPWSHALIVIDWPDRAGAAEVIGAEVALEPAPGVASVPERNGVTLVSLDRYLDPARYPSLAFAALKLGDSERIGPEVKEALVDAALHPCRERARYPLWHWMGAWTRYAHSGGPNPLEESVAHPAAAFCEYVYGAAGLDIAPGATEANICPEMLWNTLLYWYERLEGRSGALAAWACIEEGWGAGRTPLPSNLVRDLRALRRERDAARATQGKTRKTRKKSTRRRRSSP